MSSAISSGVLIRRASRKTCCPSTTVEPCGLQGGEDRHLDEVDADRLVGRPCSASSTAILRATSSAMPASGWKAPRSVEMPARARFVAVEPRVVELVVPGGRAEVPDDRLAAAGEQREADQLVHRPGADVGGRHVADVGEVEGQQGAEVGALQRRHAAAPAARRAAGRGRPAAPSRPRSGRRCGSPSPCTPFSRRQPGAITETSGMTARPGAFSATYRS